MTVALDLVPQWGDPWESWVLTYGLVYCVSYTLVSHVGFGLRYRRIRRMRREWRAKLARWKQELEEARLAAQDHPHDHACEHQCPHDAREE